ncbi:DUF1481 domain-containing protein [Vibrio ordalii]|uniref:DUF1481 domain-containing protein n=1 Tax=Vibrio ordalii TaxID=28174 RepID=UPI0025765BFD|nr:DUF1481 domain-containing protein [Vibrio ordalii]MCS0350773.1 DUF1481 domain-containing protein [Vibrio ordalii]
MKKILLSILFPLVLVGCSSSSHTPSLEQYSNYTSGQTMGDATSFYWYIERSASPNSAADYVASGDYGWYKTNYRWDEGTLRELKREGEQLQKKSLVPYSVHLRFNDAGEAIYQQYRVDGKILPLDEEQLSHYLQQAQYLISETKNKDNQGLELIQGVWDGEVFETCTGHEYTLMEFNQTLPSFVVSRLASLDNYIAFLGKIRNNRVYIEELLMLADENHGCIEKPQLLK